MFPNGKCTKYIRYILHLPSVKIVHLNKQVKNIQLRDKKPSHTPTLFSLNHTLTCGGAFQAAPPEGLLLLAVMTVIGIGDDGAHFHRVSTPDDDDGSERRVDMRRGEKEGNVTCQTRGEGTQKKGELNENKEGRTGQVK